MREFINGSGEPLPEGVEGVPVGRHGPKPARPAARRLAVLVATLPAVELGDDHVYPADVANEHDSAAADGDDTCRRCDSYELVCWHGEVGVREPVNVWSCTGCGTQWTTRVRRASGDLESAA